MHPISIYLTRSHITFFAWREWYMVRMRPGATEIHGQSDIMHCTITNMSLV